jgi:hypothetical protein
VELTVPKVKKGPEPVRVTGEKREAMSLVTNLRRRRDYSF